MKKYGIAAVLVIVIAFLAYLLWLETKALVITLVLMAVCVVALYFVLRKM